MKNDEGFSLFAGYLNYDITLRLDSNFNVGKRINSTIHTSLGGMAANAASIAASLGSRAILFSGIGDDEIAQYHMINYPKAMSLSRAYNSLIKERLTDKGWMDEPRLFSDSNFHDKAWRLDFAKGKIAVEVSFNHGEALAWNMMKLTLAAEMNHVEKEFQSKVGIIILATADLKKAGGFDGACGEWEKAVRYLKPMQSQLSSPILLLGIEAPAFKIIDHGKDENPRTSIEWHSDTNQRSLFEF